MKEIIVNTQLPVIKTNFEEVKESLIVNLEKYKGIVVTEENQKDCKAMQKELAGFRNQIDTERKAIKKQVEAPIKKFDTDVKELVGIITEIEKPIKEGIKVFDDRRKEEKRKFADVKIFEICQKLGLEKKYADQLTVLDKYLNLSASAKSVVEDIEQRAESLKQQQNMDKCKLELLKGSIETTLEAVNETIKTPLKFETFEKFIDMGWDAARIIREINERATQIRQAEKAAEEMATKRIEEEKQKEEVQIPMDLKPKAPEVHKEVEEDEPRLYVELYVEHNLEEMKILSKYLKDKGYKYIVREQGKVNPK